jgi:hypothetical protein
MSVTDTAGDVLKFYDFGSAPPAARKGLFQSLTVPNQILIALFPKLTL